MSNPIITWELLRHTHYGRLPTDRRHKYEFSYVIQRGSKGEYILRNHTSHVGNFSDLESAKTHAEELERNK